MEKVGYSGEQCVGVHIIPHGRCQKELLWTCGLWGTTLGSPLVLRTRAETWVFPHNPRPLVFFLLHKLTARHSSSLGAICSLTHWKPWCMCYSRGVTRRSRATVRGENSDPGFECRGQAKQPPRDFTCFNFICHYLVVYLLFFLVSLVYFSFLLPFSNSYFLLSHLHHRCFMQYLHELSTDCNVCIKFV